MRTSPLLQGLANVALALFLTLNAALAHGAGAAVAANAACPGGASWCAQGQQAKAMAREAGSFALIPAEHTAAAMQGDYFVEGRMRAAPREGGKSVGFIIAGYQDEKNWLGFGLEVTPGSDRLVLLISQMVDGKLEHHKRVGRAVDAPGAYTTLRLDRADHSLTLHVNGVRTIGIDHLKLPPGRVGSFVQGGEFDIDGLRAGDVKVAPVSIGLAHSGLQVNLQAGLSGLAGRTGHHARAFPVRVASRDGMAAVRFAAVSSNPAVVRAAIDQDKLILTPLLAGQASVSVTSLDDTNVGLTVTANVVPAFAHSNQHYALKGRVEPQVQDQAVAIDSVVRLRLDGKPQLGKVGTVRIIRVADDVVVDEVHVGQEVNAIGAARDGFKRVVRFQAIALDGNTLRVKLHDDRLAYDTEYFVVVDGNLLTSAEIDGKPFTGIGKAAGWRFRTRATGPKGDLIKVDDDGPADFRTVQGALNHAMRNLARGEPATIQVANGRYDELLYLRGKDNLTLRGESREGVQIAFENNDGRNGGSGAGQPPLGPGANGGRAVFLIEDADLVRMDNLSITNTTWNSKTIGGQAETIHFSSQGRFIATHVNFVSEQDTIQVKGYSWFYQCLIAGTVDFIWGNNHAALFEESEIRSLGHSAGSERGGYVVQARTVSEQDPGFVFLNSRLTHGPGPAGNDVLPGSIYLARPGVASAWDKVSYVNSRIGAHIAPAGWFGTPRGGNGWTESGSTDLAGHPLKLDQRTGGRLLDGAVITRAGVFAGFDNGRGWYPEPRANDGRDHTAVRGRRLREMEPPPSLSEARIEAEGGAQKAAWNAYLARSRMQLAADQAALGAERAALATDQPGRAVPAPVLAGGSQDGGMPLNRAAAWYGSHDAIRIAENIVSFQTPAGGWGKNVNRNAPVRLRGQHYIAFETPRESWNFVGTIDNGATVTELGFLARVQSQVGPDAAARYRASFVKGMDYLLSSQYPNGGLPQVYPLQGGYHDAITLNDNALGEVMEFFLEAAARGGDYAFVPAPLAARAALAADKMVRLVLAMQIEVNGVKTGWCQQHDALTLAPVGARNFEPIALASVETAQMLTVLMQLPEPSSEVKAAIHAGIAWLEKTALRDVEFSAPDAQTGRMLMKKAGAGPVWSRYYDIQSMKPIFGDRDQTIHEDVSEISKERRNGYSWFNSGPLKALQRYANWSGK